MALLDALGQKLQDDGVGTLAVDIFLTRMRENPDQQIVLYESQGFPPVEQFGDGIAGLYRPLIRVMCRAGRFDYPTARGLAEQVQQSLGTIRHTTLSGVVFKSVLDTTGVYPMRYDEQDRPNVGVDFVAWIEP